MKYATLSHLGRSFDAHMEKHHATPTPCQHERTFWLYADAREEAERTPSIQACERCGMSRMWADEKSPWKTVDVSKLKRAARTAPDAPPDEPWIGEQASKPMEVNQWPDMMKEPAPSLDASKGPERVWPDMWIGEMVDERGNHYANADGEMIRPSLRFVDARRLADRPAAPASDGLRERVRVIVDEWEGENAYDYRRVRRLFDRLRMALDASEVKP